MKVNERKQQEMKNKMERLVEKLKAKGLNVEKVTYKKRAH
jgi:dipeptidyl aminopeptidase/acylaminoacyl peptidase